MATVTLSGIHKRYSNDAHAVRGVDMEIGDGELIVFVGPSGCGKSTLLRMVAGLETITEGEIAIDGRRINDVSPADRDVAMVFQNYALYPHMSVYENIAFGLRMRKTDAAELRRRVDATAEMLGIGDLLERQPRQLSGGQRQRVAMGRALVLTRSEVVTFPVQVTHYFGGQSTFWAKIAAMSVIGTVPVFFAVATLQRFLVRGITMGAVKG